MISHNFARGRGLAPLRLACARLRCASPLPQPDGPPAQGCALCPECDISKWLETGDISNGAGQDCLHLVSPR
jgi:hypothetical protein